MIPAFVAGWEATALKAQVAFGLPQRASLAPPENALERRYALRAVQQRLHQASSARLSSPLTTAVAPCQDCQSHYSWMLRT